MSDLHYKKNKKKSGGKGFYIALGICLIAVGAAAWMTYDNVAQYTKMPEASAEPSSAIETENTLSGLPKTPESTPTPTPNHDADLTIEPESSDPSEAPESSEPQQEAVSEPDTGEAGLMFSGAEEQQFISPAGNTVLKAFSGEELVYSETMKDWRVHTGMDLAATAGDTVHSIGNGVVKEWYSDEMYGNVAVISYDDLDVYYCGLGDTALVKEGQNVVIGQDIGSIGTMPCESIEPAHLHIGFQKNGEWIDPADLLPG